MIGSVLYYPHIEPKRDWLLCAALFCDEINTIVPKSIEEPFNNEDSARCYDAGILKPLHCEVYGATINEIGRRIVDLVQQVDTPEVRRFIDSMGDPGSIVIHGQKFGAEIRQYLLHPAKMPKELMALFPGAARTNQHQDWLLVSAQFAEQYMAVLAATLAREAKLSPITPDAPSYGINLNTLLNDISAGTTGGARAAVINLTMRGLRIRRDTDITSVLHFRARNKDHFASISGYFDVLATAMGSCGDAHELEQQASHIYQTKLEPELARLERELRLNNIASSWDAVVKAVTVTAPAAGALNYLTGFSGTALLGAGAAITVGDVLVKGYLTAKKTKSASPLTYLMEARERFEAPVWER